MKITGADIIIETLIEQGVDTVFGYPGGAVLNIYDALYKNSDRIRHVMTAHEQGAAHAADGYARITGKTGVVLSTSGPGATNLVTGIATAYMDSIPMVAITGNVGTGQIGKDSFQQVVMDGKNLLEGGGGAYFGFPHQASAYLRNHRYEGVLLFQGLAGGGFAGAFGAADADVFCVRMLCGRGEVVPVADGVAFYGGGGDGKFFSRFVVDEVVDAEVVGHVFYIEFAADDHVCFGKSFQNLPEVVRPLFGRLQVGNRRGV